MAITAPEKAFAFNPVTIEVTGISSSVKIARVEIRVGSETVGSIKRKPVNGTAVFDVSALLQTIFERRNLLPKENTANTFKLATYRLFFDNNFQQDGTFDTLWGALQIGEQYNQFRKLTFFTEFPFTIPVFFNEPGRLYVKKDNAAFVDWRAVPAKKHEIDIAYWKTAVNKVIIQNGIQSGSVWDSTFDSTFRVVLNIPLYIEFELTVNKCTEGVYLRWINKYGDFCYWLFNKETEQNSVSNIAVNIEEYLKTVDFINNFSMGTNHPKGKEPQRSIALFAPLVDSEAFDFLNTLMDSPVVDLYRGDNKWVRVNIAPANVVKSDDDLQDFACTLVLPTTFTQEL